MIAIISDIHGNLEAFQAVLKDIFSRNITEVICLGDVVGYGPEPAKCLELSKKLKLCMMGNHEEAVIQGAKNFTQRAAEAIAWTKKKLTTPDEAYFELIKQMPKNVLYQGATFVHASPRDATTEYVLPSDVKDLVKMQDLFDMFDDICFVGHTHFPGVIYEENDTFFRPADIDNTYYLSDGKAIINVGSVGQSRDGDTRSCYVTFDGYCANFHRVEYDYKKTMEKIFAIDELDNFFAERLEQGK